MIIIASNKKGFTMIELALVVVIMILVGGISAPVYQSFYSRSSLDTAVTDTVHLLTRAQALAQAGEQDSVWSVRVEGGRAFLFLGANFSGRNQAFDEISQISSNIGISGDQEIVFAKVTGEPQITPPAAIVLTAPSGEVRQIVINAKGMLEY